MKVKTLVCSLCVICMTTSSFADTQETKISNIENYLNNLSTLKGKIRQTAVNEEGKTEEIKAKFLLKRPGMMKIVYDQPALEIIANDPLFVFFDKELDQETNVAIDSIPAAQILLRKQIDLQNADIQVESIEEVEGRLEMATFLKEDPGAGKIIMAFQQNPLKLVGWRFIDSLGQTTNITFEEMVSGAAISSAEFSTKRQKSYGVEDEQNL